MRVSSASYFSAIACVLAILIGVTACEKERLGGATAAGYDERGLRLEDLPADLREALTQDPEIDDLAERSQQVLLRQRSVGFDRDSALHLFLRQFDHVSQITTFIKEIGVPAWQFALDEEFLNYSNHVFAPVVRGRKVTGYLSVLLDTVAFANGFMDYLSVRHLELYDPETIGELDPNVQAYLINLLDGHVTAQYWLFDRVALKALRASAGIDRDAIETIVRPRGCIRQPMYSCAWVPCALAVPPERLPEAESAYVRPRCYEECHVVYVIVCSDGPDIPSDASPPSGGSSGGGGGGDVGSGAGGGGGGGGSGDLGNEGIGNRPPPADTDEENEVGGTVSDEIAAIENKVGNLPPDVDDCLEGSEYLRGLATDFASEYGDAVNCQGKTAKEALTEALRGACSETDNRRAAGHFADIEGDDWIDLSNLNRDCSCASDIIESMLTDDNIGLCSGAGYFDGLTGRGLLRIQTDMPPNPQGYGNDYWDDNPGVDGITLIDLQGTVTVVLNPTICQGVERETYVPGLERTSRVDIARLFVHEGYHARFLAEASSYVNIPMSIQELGSLDEVFNALYLGADAEVECYNMTGQHEAMIRLYVEEIAAGLYELNYGIGKPSDYLYQAGVGLFKTSADSWTDCAQAIWGSAALNEIQIAGENMLDLDPSFAAPACP